MGPAFPCAKSLERITLSANSSSSFGNPSHTGRAKSQPVEEPRWNGAYEGNEARKGMPLQSSSGVAFQMIQTSSLWLVAAFVTFITLGDDSTSPHAT